MSSDRILERTAIRLERYVTAINDSVPDCRGIAKAAMPWSFRPVSFSRAEIPWLIYETRRVLSAVALHARAAPVWANPLPVGDEISPLLRSTSGSMCLLGYYACSLMMASYDYPGHASFFDYGCGVMVHSSAPDHVRDAPELQAEFPAKELPGLSGRLVWYGESLPRLPAP